MQNLGMAFACVGLAYLAFEYDSILCGLGALIAFGSLKS